MCVYKVILTFFQISPIGTTSGRKKRDTTCKTRDGYGPCIFPFIYEGKTYEKCTTDGFSLDDDPWCPYEVDENGVYSGGLISGKWNYCEDIASCRGKIEL